MGSELRKKERHKEWYARNRERVLAKQRERAADPEWREKKNRQARELQRQRRMDPERRAKDYAYNNAYIRRQKYGLSPEEYEALAATQGGRCAICRKRQEKRSLAVDHCHETGLVRGLLCLNCNAGLGNLGDTPEALARALKYLKDARKKLQAPLL